MQTKLHQWAKADPGRRFDDLANLVYDPAFLVVAWARVGGNKGARTAGVDRVAPRSIVFGVAGLLGGLRDDLKAGRFVPQRVREKTIPKTLGKVRRLGISTTADRVVQASLKLVLEPIFEADFTPCSGAPSPCPFCCWCVVEEPGIGPIHLDSQAFSASGADVDGFELAALDTLQHGLAGHAEGVGGFEHGEPAGRGVVDEAGPQFVGHADTPRGAGGELFAGDEPIVEPAVHGGSSDAEDLGRVGDGDELAVGLLGRSLVTRDLPVMPQGLDDGGGEPLAGGAAPTLAVQDAGDGGVGVVDGEPAQQLDGVLVGAVGGLVGAAQLDDELGGGAARLVWPRSGLVRPGVATGRGRRRGSASITSAAARVAATPAGARAARK